MTTYLCAHPSHARGDHSAGVDVTAQVRIERSLAPRTLVYLAHTETVLRQVPRLEPSLGGPQRVAAVQRILTGDTWPVEAPVLLLSDTNTDRAPGLYELDELRRANTVVERIATRWVDGATVTPVRDDVVVVDEGPTPTGTSAAQLAGVATEIRARNARVLPQGVYPLADLSAALAAAEPSEESLVDAIAATPASGPLRTQGALEPWRVVVPCPVVEAQDAGAHEVMFGGDGSPEPPVVTGTTAGGIELALEHSGAHDLAPSFAVARLARRVDLLLVGELVAAVALTAAAWASGGLAFAARETPGWLGFGIAFALIAIVFAVAPRFAPDATDRSPDDTIELRRFYGSRLELLAWAPMLSVAAFALALLCALVPPALAGGPVVGPPSVEFLTSEDPVLARLTVATRDVATTGTVHVEVVGFADRDATGAVLVRLHAAGDETGAPVLGTMFALRPGTRYLTVATWTGTGEAPPCTPARSTGDDCTLVAVPPLGPDDAAATTLGSSSMVGATVPPAVTTTPTVSLTPSPSATP